jgi:hypothetical protein
MTISNDLLQANRTTLERRLRDLGLLVGVNDAEAMKRLRPRFDTAAGEDQHAIDGAPCEASEPGPRKNSREA